VLRAQIRAVRDNLVDLRPALAARVRQRHVHVGEGQRDLGREVWVDDGGEVGGAVGVVPSSCEFGSWLDEINGAGGLRGGLPWPEQWIRSPTRIACE
jgi:hypothetical protein